MCPRRRAPERTTSVLIGERHDPYGAVWGVLVTLSCPCPPIQYADFAALPAPALGRRAGRLRLPHHARCMEEMEEEDRLGEGERVGAASRLEHAERIGQALIAAEVRPDVLLDAAAQRG